MEEDKVERKSPARRPRLRRTLRLVGLATLVLAGGLTLLYTIRLGALRARVLKEFAALANNSYSHVVAAPIRVRVGTDARASGVAARLGRAGLKRVRDVPELGEFRVDGGAIQFCDAPVTEVDTRAPVVTLVLDGPVIEHIDVDGRARESVLLPTEHITSFRKSLRERRSPVAYEDMPPGLVLAVLAAEDRRFFGHAGLDSRGIGRAFVHNLRERRVVEGGSTITQQVVKQILRRRGRGLRAKLDEAILALVLERRFSKPKILQVYLNEVYLGQEGPYAIHGVAQGARFFFGKPLHALSRRERIELAAAIRAPNAASPRRNPERLQSYADAVEAAIEEVAQPEWSGEDTVGSNGQAEPNGQAGRNGGQSGQAGASGRAGTSAYGASSTYREQGVRVAVDASEPIHVGLSQMAYYFDVLEREWREARGRYRLHGPVTLVAGVDPLLQLRAARALQEGLDEARQRSQQANRNVTREEHAQASKLQGAIVVVDPATGALRALVGGYDYMDAPFNRAVDSARPVGSTFKPIVFLAALGGRVRDPRITQSTWLPDEQREYRVGRSTWRPANFDDKYRGWVTAREALAHSVNAATVALGMDVGVKAVARLAEDMGLHERVIENPSILLGAVDTSPLRLAGAYATMANKGYTVTPHALVEVRTRARTIPLHADAPPRVLDPEVAYVVTDMLVAAMRTGTGRSAERHGFKHLATGKTGTSDGERDAWFVGYTPELVTTVWIGHDDNREMHLTGARAALPVWVRLMRGWLGQGWDLDFDPPPGITFRRIDAQTGGLATSRCQDVEIAAYMDGTAPDRGCEEHGAYWDRNDHRAAEDARRDRWLGMRKKRGFWARLKDALGV